MEEVRHLDSSACQQPAQTAYIVYIKLIDRLSVFDLIQYQEQKVFVLYAKKDIGRNALDIVYKTALLYNELDMFRTLRT